MGSVSWTWIHLTQMWGHPLRLLACGCQANASSEISEQLIPLEMFPITNGRKCSDCFAGESNLCDSRFMSAGICIHVWLQLCMFSALRLALSTGNRTVRTLN